MQHAELASAHTPRALFVDIEVGVELVPRLEEVRARMFESANYDIVILGLVEMGLAAAGVMMELAA